MPKKKKMSSSKSNSFSRDNCAFSPVPSNANYYSLFHNINSRINSRWKKTIYRKVDDFDISSSFLEGKIAFILILLMRNKLMPPQILA